VFGFGFDAGTFFEFGDLQRQGISAEIVGITVTGAFDSDSVDTSFTTDSVRLDFNSFTAFGPSTITLLTRQVPEPPAFTLLALGLVGFAVVRHQRNTGK
jgi:hypothetical protein